MNNKDLIKQYVDTGLKIPEYQLSKLPSNLQTTYIRKRLIRGKHDYDFEEYEVKYMNAAQCSELSDLIHRKKDGSFGQFQMWELNMLPEKDKEEYIYSRVKKGQWISESIFKALPDEVKVNYVSGVAKHIDRALKDYELPYLPDNLIYNYFFKRVNKVTASRYSMTSQRLNAAELTYLPERLLIPYFEVLIQEKVLLDDSEFKFLTPKLMSEYIEARLLTDYFPIDLFSYANDNQKMRIAEKLMEKDGYIPYYKIRDWYQDRVEHG